MKNIQKFVVPLLLLIVLGTIYLTYFNPQKGIGSFADFDTNNNANKDIKVYVAKERDFSIDPASGSIVFHGRDKNGQVVKIQAPPTFSMEQIKGAETVILRGHLHKDYFHAAELILE